MSLTEVSALPLREKFQIMEAIWKDLSEQMDGFEIPPEHIELLEARRARVAAGKSELLDWDTVKSNIAVLWRNRHLDSSLRSE